MNSKERGIFAICVGLGIFLVGCVAGSRTRTPSNENDKHTMPARRPFQTLQDTAGLNTPPLATTVEFASPPAVSEAEHMKKYPSAGEYVAFSLKAAQKQIAQAKDARNYREGFPEVFNLGGINLVQGLVYDRESQDLILVGKYEADRQPLTLDDLAVAFRARFIRGEWPLVSLDPTAERAGTQLQRVRFEGGIESTQFGADLLDADYRLKRIGMGLLEAGIPNFKNYWDLGNQRKGHFRISSRFWFYPVLPTVAVRENVVALKGLEVGVFTEVLGAELEGKPVENLSTFHDDAGSAYASAISDSFAALARKHPSFSRLRGLNELVALTRGIQEMDDIPDISFWLREYRTKQVATPPTLRALTRVENRQFLSGGVKLTALALRLRSGDVTALSDAVKVTRPDNDPLTWTFVVGDWLIPTGRGTLRAADMAGLAAHAEFLQEQKRFDEAIATYDKIIDLAPLLTWPYNSRGLASAKGKRDYARAIADYSKAIEMNARSPEIFNNRGIAYSAGTGDYERAIADFSHALSLNPAFVEAWSNRGLALFKGKGQVDSAIADYKKAIEIDPQFAGVYVNYGTALAIGKQDYDSALEWYNRAIELDSSLAEAFSNRGYAYFKGKGDFNHAVEDLAKAIELNPRDSECYIDAHK